MEEREPARSLPPWIFLALLLALGFLLYRPALHGAFVYDDHTAIVANRDLEDLGERGWAALFGRRTLTDFTFALNRAAGGLDPFGYHIVNLLLHVANAFLVRLLSLLLLERLGLPAVAARRGALAASLLFLSHPVLSQAVAYTAQRYTSLATFFYLLAVLLYLRSRISGGRMCAFAAFLSGYLAMRSKEIAFTLPFLLLLLEIALFRGRERRASAALPFFLLIPLIPLSLLYGTEGTGRHIPAEGLREFRETPDVGRVPYLATQFGVVLRYLVLFFWPFGMTIDRDVALVPGLLEPSAIVPFALLVLIFAAAWSVRRRAPALAVGYAWFLLALSVESSIVPIRDLMVEHRVYLPSVGVFLAAGYLIGLAGRGSTVLLVALLVPLSIGTNLRSRVWAGPVPLWEDAVQRSPRLARPWVNLGLAYLDEGRNEEAIDAYRNALRRDASRPDAYHGLALAYERTGDAERALVAYETARRHAPDYGPAYEGIASLLRKRGRDAEAAAVLRESSARAGEEPRRLVLLGEALLAAGEPAEAESFFQRARYGDRTFEPAAIGLARVLVLRGDAEEAEALLEETVRDLSGGGSADLWNAIGAVRLARGSRARAMEAFRKALEIDPAHPEAQENMNRLTRGSRPGVD